MNVRSLFAAIGLVLACAASGWSEPARAQETAAEYGQALSALHAEMNSLTLELERFVANRRYCKPPDIPSKAEAQAELDALATRARALGERYVTLRGGLTELAKVSGPGGYLMAGDADPTSVSYWRAYEAARRRMNDALARKRAALAAAPELDCRPKPKPQPAPVATTGGSFEAPATPVRPTGAATVWPELPRQFCSEAEKTAFVDRLNKMTEQVAADLEQAAKFRADVERAINEYVQRDQRVPASLFAQRRQAAADFAAQERRLREADATVSRANAIPVVDCGRDRQTGMTDLDFRKVEGQQAMIGQAEGMIAEIDSLRRAGRCQEMYNLLDRLREFLYRLRHIPVDGRDPQRRAAFPPELLDDLRRRAGAATQPCPPAGTPPPPPSLDELRKAYRAAAQGDDAAAFRVAKERLLKALDEAVATETRDAQSDRLIRERDEVRTAEPVRPGVLDEIGALPPRAPSQTGFIPPDRGMQVVLEEHNRLRAAYRVPPLRWDPALAAAAQAYAQHLARTGRLAHAPREGRGAARENLSQGMLGWGPREMLGNWLREERLFRAGTYPNVTTTGRWEDVSHFTQMIWPKTTSLGCGLAVGSGHRWLVCRYLPGGNRDGDYVGPAGGGLRQDAGANPAPTQPQGPPPPPPLPTARDPAPGGDEAKHPLVGFANGAFSAFTEAWRNGDRAEQERELTKMRYALDQLRKRLKAARKAGPYSTVDPAKVEHQVKDLERMLETAQARYEGRGEFG